MPIIDLHNISVRGEGKDVAMHCSACNHVIIQTDGGENLVDLIEEAQGHIRLHHGGSDAA